MSDNPIVLPYTFESTAYSSVSDYDYNSVQFQVASDTDFTNLEFDLIRDYENIFGAHPANAQFVDLHKNIDIFKQELTKTDLNNGKHYIRVRHRDKNIEWSEWSDIVTFTTTGGKNPPPIIKTNKNLYTVGESITTLFSYSEGQTGQWIGLYKEGQTPGKDTPSSKWSYVAGTEGEHSFKDGLTNPGVYYAIIFRDAEYDILAESKLFYVGDIPKITTNKDIYKKNENVKVNIIAAPYLTKDWIGIYNEFDDPGNGPKAVKYLYVGDNNNEYLFENLPVGSFFASYFMGNKYFEPGERAYFEITDDEILADIIQEKDEIVLKIQYDSKNHRLKAFYENNRTESGTIYDLNGKIVKKFSLINSVTIPTNSFSPNIYILCVGNHTEKVLIY